MNATPKTMAMQVRKAHAAAHRFDAAPIVRLAFTSETGVKRRPYVEEVWDEFCFICSRATDHMGEHWDRVEVNECETTEYYVERENVIVRTHWIRTYEAEGPLTREATLAAENI